jgi:DNA-binding NarL/FixJ family response regulator
MPKRISLAIVEDQKQTREGLVALIGGTPGFRVAGAFASMEAALRTLHLDPPDVVLLDIGLPGMSGVEGVLRLRDRFPTLQILMLTVYEDNEHVFQAVCNGACGYLLKDTPPGRLVDAIRELAEGGAPMSPEIARKVVTLFQQTARRGDVTHNLSPRELEVLTLLVDGHSYKTAAAALSLSEDTVRFHIRNIYEKLHVHSKSEAVVKAFRSGLLR